MLATKRPLMDSGWRNILRKVPSSSVLYYPALPEGFDAATIKDYSGNANNGTITGGATWTRLPSGLWGLSFNGVNAYVDCGKPASLQDLPVFTWRCWAKVDNLTTNYYVMAKRSYKHIIIMTNDPTPTAYLRGGVLAATTSALTTTNETVVAGAWNLITMTYDNTGDRKIYFKLNGVPCTYATQTAAVGAMTLEDNAIDGKFIIGAYSTTETRFPGDIFLPQIFNVVVTDSEDKGYFNRTRHLLGV